ncbi:MAG: hypothetical protein MJ016_06875 [Victivallaceae bacterium]|nr:hypothetical protein [Victivallaceae bacterium]
MIDSTTLGRIKHYFYDPVFGSTSLLPLGTTLVLSPLEKFYDGKIINGNGVDERDILISREIQISIETKNVDGALDLLGEIVSDEPQSESALRFIPRGGNDPVLVFGKTRLRGTAQWRLNTESDQSIVLDFIARPDESGRLFYRT